MALRRWRALAPLMLILGCGGQPDSPPPGGTPAPDCTVEEQRFFYPDGDGDTYPAPASDNGDNLVLACEPPEGFVAVDDPVSALYDCDDEDASTFPGAIEGGIPDLADAPLIADGIDNDCDTKIDEGTQVWDDDGDQFCEIGFDINGDGDCLDVNEEEPLYADCDDGNGCAEGDLECLGQASATNPQASEGVFLSGAPLGTGFDSDCDGMIDEGTHNADDDQDGYCEAGFPVYFAPADSSIESSSADVTSPWPGYCGAPGEPQLGGDGALIPGSCICYGEPEEVNPALIDCADDPDINPDAAGINPGALEIPYDDIDQNCDGADVLDLDGDGFESEDDCNDGGACYQAYLLCSGGSGGDGFDAPPTCDELYNSCLAVAAKTNPSATEVPYDNIDQDCDGFDLGDVDGDGYCSSILLEDDDADPSDPYYAPGDCLYPQGDCDDANPGIFPGAEEDGQGGDSQSDAGLSGDGVDNDCDGNIDESTINRDDDGDGFCEAGYPVRFVPSPGQPTPLQSPEELKDACGGDPANFPTYEAVIDGEIVDVPYEGDCLCDGDMNGDGIPDVLSQGSLTDCDDSEATSYPGATEIPYDMADQNCDGLDVADVDQDGYCLGGLAGYDYGSAYCDFNARDCDDDDGDVHPGMAEIPYDGIDQDCDEYRSDLLDVDGDGFCPSVDALQAACDATCDPEDLDCQERCDDIATAITPETCPRAEEGDDCNDRSQAVYPGAPEDGLFGASSNGDGLDNNCNGAVDEGTIHRDDDEDGFCEAGFTVLFTPSTDYHLAAPPPEGYESWGTYPWPGYCAPESEEDQRILRADGSLYPGDCLCTSDNGLDLADCDDGNADRYPGNEEVPYDRIDQDCDELNLDVADVDGDGYCKKGLSAQGYSYGLADCPLGISDCDDEDPTVNPEGEEGLTSDSQDNDCDGQVDEGTLGKDDDGDGASESEGDCDDNNDDVFPGATELPYDTVDQDCDGLDLADVDGDGYCKEGLVGYPYGSVASCALGIGDCDDDDDGINPGEADIPGNGIDEDCSGADTEDFDLDDDGFTAAEGDCDDGDRDIRPCVGEDCPVEAADGVDNDCDGCIDEGAWDMNDVVISEVMANPLGQDSNREYVELHNTGEGEAFVNGFTLSTEEDTLLTLGEYAPGTTIPSGAPLALSPGGRLLILKTDNSDLNGGINISGLNAYVFDKNTWSIPNIDGRLYLSAFCSEGYHDVDDIDYAPGGSWEEGVAAEVDRGYLLNPESAPYALCEAVSPYGDEGNLGSPGQVNDRCVDDN